VKYGPIARQRLGKHIPAGSNARNNKTLLGNGSVNTPKTIRDNRTRCFPWGPPRGYITRSSKGAVSCFQKLREFSWRTVHLSELLSRSVSSSRDGNQRWLRRNSKEGIRLWKEDFICDLKLHWNCKSIVRIRLVKTENPSACVTVNCKMCRSAIDLYCLSVVPSWVYEVSIKPILQSRTRLKARPHYSCSCYSLYTLRVNIGILTRRSLASNWSSVDEDLRAQVKARRVSRRAQAWRAPARGRVMWTHLYKSRTRKSF
jgi:hypothetical protein